MIRDLLTPEAQADAYVWAAVLLAHTGIGVALWAALAGLCRSAWTAVLLVAVIYAQFETAQAMASGNALIWDSVLDWSAVTLGAVLAAGLWRGSLRRARGAVVAIGIIAAVGAWKRSGRKQDDGGRSKP